MLAILGAHRGERKSRSASSTSVSSRDERVGRTVGVDGGQRAVVPGVERLEHVERLRAPDLADDEAVGPHAQRGPHQRAHADPAGTLGIRRPCFEPHHVRLREPQLGRLLDRDDALGGGDRAGERVQQGRLARARASGDEHVPSRHDRPAEERRRRVAEPERGERNRAGAEPADGDARAVDGERRDDGVETRAVGKACVDHRRRTVEAQAEGADDALDEAHDAFVVECERDRLEAPVALDVGAAGPVEHHLGDGGVGEERFERTQAHDFVGELRQQPLEAGGREQRLFVSQQVDQTVTQRVGREGGVVAAFADDAGDALASRARRRATLPTLGRRVPAVQRSCGRAPVRRTHAHAHREAARGTRENVGQPRRENTGVDRMEDGVAQRDPGDYR